MTPTEVVARFIEAIERKDVDAAVAMTAPGISYENMPITPIVGHEGLAATLRSFLDPVDQVEWRILRELASGSTVVNERLDRFRIGNGWLELPVAGVFEVDGDGKLTLWRDYFDMGTYVRQLTELTGG
jgi:limonene-1,2-epoxide hydrolase